MFIPIKIWQLNVSAVTKKRTDCDLCFYTYLHCILVRIIWLSVLYIYIYIYIYIIWYIINCSMYVSFRNGF
jgi:hypothetical protein